MDDQHSVPVPPRQALLKRFYTPLLLLVCLTSLCSQRRLAEEPELSPAAGLEHLFHVFVSKVAYLCCTDVGSSTISACTVLQLPDCIQYVIGFNQLSPMRRANIESSITSILALFATTSLEKDLGKKAIKMRALRASLELCQDRVSGYVKALNTQLLECIKACKRDATLENEALQVALCRISTVLEPCLDGFQAVPVSDLISYLDSFFHSNLLAHVRHRMARENDMMSTSYWSDLVHVAGRLLSYKRAIDLIASVATIWPQLFSDFQVRTIPSSSAELGVLPTNPWTAVQISSRMYSDETSLTRIKQQLDSFTAHNIDAEIAKMWRHAPKPIVHAEMLVHSWLENTEGGIRPERFSKHWEFIGTSKPPCKLCSYFFDEYPTDVRVRSSHQNVYFAWRLPDVFEHQGNASIRTRALVMDTIKSRIRADVARVIAEKVSEGRPHDSSAYTSLLPDISLNQVGRIFPEGAAAQLLQSLTISQTQEQSTNAPRSREGVEEVFEEDDEEVLLFTGRSGVRKAV